jgi:hypothetical protein
MTLADFPIVTTLGQPLEVVKTTMAANRGDGFVPALTRVWGRGGIFGCKYLPLSPQRHQKTSEARTTGEARR